MNTELINGDGGRPRSRRRLGRGALYSAAIAAIGLLLAACGGSGGPSVAHLGATAAPTAASAASRAQGALAFSQCMRRHGLTNFPDPSGGSIQISGGPGSGLDPRSAQFQAAQTACQALLQNGGAPSPAEQAAAQKAALQFSQCMRAHGIANFPDPQFQSGPGGGGITFQVPSSMDPNSPQFSAAQATCQKLMPRGGGTVSSSGNGGGPGGGVVTRGGS